MGTHSLFHSTSVALVLVLLSAAKHE